MGIKKKAPHRGILPEIFNHSIIPPQKYTLDRMVREKVSDTITRQFLMGVETMLVKWTLKKGAHIPLHFHRSEQISWITEGKIKVKSQGKTFIVKRGEVIVFPPFTPHEFIVLEDTINIDLVAPIRLDWLTETKK